MKKNDYLKMMEQDLVTATEQEMPAVFELAKEVLASAPSDFEIDDQKLTLHSLFANMKEHAQKNQKNGFYYFKAAEAKEFAANFFGISTQTKKEINLEDFF